MTETQPNKIAGQAQANFLRGDRIYLRCPTMNDAERIFHWERDDEVWRYDPHRPFSNSMAQFLPVFERNYVRGNGRQFWFIIEDEKHIPIGTITYFNIDYRLGQVEIGLGLGRRNPHVGKVSLFSPRADAHLRGNRRCQSSFSARLRQGKLCRGQPDL